MRFGLMLACLYLSVFGVSSVNAQLPTLTINHEVRQPSPAPMSDGSAILERPARISLQGIGLPAALTELRNRAGIKLIFSESLLPLDARVSCDCGDATVAEALEQLLTGTGLGYDAVHSQLLIVPLGPAETEHSGTRRVSTVEVGTITGAVVDAATRRPLAGAQVSIPASQVGTVTNSAGNYILTNVPAGEVTVRAELIGHSSVETVVTVAVGSSVTANFELAEQALALDEIVVTGTAGQARRREVGNAITQVNTAEIAEPLTNVDQLLTHAPGVSVQVGSGGMGGGAQIRLRGNVSASLSNQPLIYVDGVRVRGDSYLRSEGRMTASPLNDINPNDIARIEVIRGAAASTLYGAEAAVGVIQIFTKQGDGARPSWSFQMDQGFDRAREFGGGPENPYLNLDPWLKTGRRQSVNLSTSGGGTDVRYFLSGSFEDASGVLPNEYLQRFAVRGNINLNPHPMLDVQFNSSLTRSDIENVVSGNAALGFHLNVFRGDQNTLGSAEKEDIDQLLVYKSYNEIGRSIFGVTTRFTPRSWLVNRLTLGYDRADQEARGVAPFEFVARPEGFVNTRRLTSTAFTADYVSTAELDVRPGISTSFSLGGQFTSNSDYRLNSRGEGLGGPGEPTVNSAARTSGGENRLRVISAGAFVQNLLGFGDRLFITTGLRADGNSAFGSNLGVQFYPKVSASYVASDEDFWPEQAGVMRLRAAYGHAGRAPGAFDAVRTWNPVGWGPNPAFWPGNVGNADLAPERTAEIELGFEHSIFDGRLTTDFTWYNARTSDALFAVQQIPSIGFGGSQLENVGELMNRGIELSVTGEIVRTQELFWELGMNIATNRSEVLDMGGAPDFSLDFGGWVMTGQPVPIMVGERVLNPTELADPVFEENAILGPNVPTHTIGLQTSIGLPRGMRLLARGEYQGGHYINARAIPSSMSREVRGWPMCEEWHALRDAGRYDEVPALNRSECFSQFVHSDRHIYPADFFRFRELTLSAPVAFAFPGVDNATLTLSARNFWTWLNSDWPMFDPEMSSQSSLEHPVRHLREGIPAPMNFTASLRVVL